MGKRCRKRKGRRQISAVGPESGAISGALSLPRCEPLWPSVLEISEIFV